jgi:hypothetical protein
VYAASIYLTYLTAAPDTTHPTYLTHLTYATCPTHPTYATCPTGCYLSR